MDTGIPRRLLVVGRSHTLREIPRSADVEEEPMAHPLFGPEIREMLAGNDVDEMKFFCETLHPATVAEALAGEVSVEETWRFISGTDIANQATIFEYLPIEWQIEMVGGVGQQRMARLIESMSHDDRASLLRKLKPQVMEGLLRLVDEADRRDIATLVQYPDGSAGAIMTTDYAWLPAHIRAAEALERLRLQAPNRETIYYVYILDDDRKLLGMISLRELILTSQQSILRDIMKKDLITVSANADRRDVANVLAQYDLIVVPVVDAENHLVGIITHDDVIDLMVKTQTEEMLRMGGVEPGALDIPYLTTPFFSLIQKRAVWLVVLFLGEMLTATAMGFFEEEIEKAVVLALFVPLIISSGGNSGSQATSLIIRALALGEVKLRDWWRVCRREIISGTVLGTILGSIGFLRITVWSLRWNSYGEHWPLVGATVGVSLVGVVLWGSVSGALLPFLLKRCGVDPATSSAPFVATLVDVTGLIIYFTVASIILHGTLL